MGIGEIREGKGKRGEKKGKGGRGGSLTPLVLLC